MATTRTTFTLDDDLAAAAQRLGINISAAARKGVAVAVAEARSEADRAAYLRTPELADDEWEGAEAWGEP